MKRGKRTIRGWVTAGAGVCLVLWLALVGYTGWAMRQPPEVFGHVMAHMPMPAFFVLPFETLWMQARKGHLEVGKPAPSLVVRSLDEKSTVDLGSLWARGPVVLVFGSYT